MVLFLKWEGVFDAIVYGDENFVFFSPSECFLTFVFREMVGWFFFLKWEGVFEAIVYGDENLVFFFSI
jgi:hypothetical protein